MCIGDLRRVEICCGAEAKMQNSFACCHSIISPYLFLQKYTMANEYNEIFWQQSVLLYSRRQYSFFTRAKFPLCWTNWKHPYSCQTLQDKTSRLIHYLQLSWNQGVNRGPYKSSSSCNQNQSDSEPMKAWWGLWNFGPCFLFLSHP